MESIKGYDNWKTTDRDGEAQAELEDDAEELFDEEIKKYGCECGNRNPDCFQDKRTEEWSVRQGRGYLKGPVMLADCMVCGEHIIVSSEPDWESASAHDE